MHTENCQMSATIGTMLAAGIAGAAGDQRLHRNPLSYAHRTMIALAKSEHGTTKFMSLDLRIV
jgi:hypothetical protein